ncbi:MAG: hypothetical protein Q9226_000276 [Calogaya cf. arnoldii]
MALQDASSVNTSGNDHNLPEVLVSTEKEHLPPPDGGETQHYVPDGLIVGSPPFNTQNLHTTQRASDTSSSSTFWKKKRLWLPLATLVFLAAVIGGIVGGLLIHRDPPSRQVTNESPSPRTESIPSNASPVSSSTTTILPRPSAKPLNSSLASVAWKDNEGLQHRRLYYQDFAGNIKESAWNNSANGWYASSTILAQARQHSPLAAAVADLAATWTQHDGSACESCGEQTIILAYEDSENKLSVVNITSSGPRWTTPEADPRPGTGLAVNLQWRDNAPPGVRLYYQRNKDDLVSIDWESQSGLRDTGWAASGAPMASFSWGVDGGLGDPMLMDILSSGPEGVRVNWWGGFSDQHWQEPENIDVMENVQPYTALAANTDRRVYALEAGVVQEFAVSTDGLHWSRIGVVPTEN